MLKAVNEQGVRLNIKKATLRYWRSEFARSLGLKSSALAPWSMAARWAMPLVRSCSVCALVMSVIERFLELASALFGPVTKTPDQKGRTQKNK